MAGMNVKLMRQFKLWIVVSFWAVLSSRPNAANENHRSVEMHHSHMVSLHKRHQEVNEHYRSTEMQLKNESAQKHQEGTQGQCPKNDGACQPCDIGCKVDAASGHGQPTYNPNTGTLYKEGTKCEDISTTQWYFHKADICIDELRAGKVKEEPLWLIHFRLFKILGQDGALKAAKGMGAGIFLAPLELGWDVMQMAGKALTPGAAEDPTTESEIDRVKKQDAKWYDENYGVDAMALAMMGKPANLPLEDACVKAWSMHANFNKVVHSKGVGEIVAATFAQSLPWIAAYGALLDMYFSAVHSERWISMMRTGSMEDVSGTPKTCVGDELKEKMKKAAKEVGDIIDKGDKAIGTGRKTEAVTNNILGANFVGLGEQAIDGTGKAVGDALGSALGGLSDAGKGFAGAITDVKIPIPMR